MRKSTLFIGCTTALGLLMLISAVDVYLRSGQLAQRMLTLRQQVAELELTDLSLFTEARYTRHLSQADLHSAFQDSPFALEHFPSGSLVAPPGMLTQHFQSTVPATSEHKPPARNNK